MADNQADVSTPSSNYSYMRPIWDQILALLGGTKTMRAAGRELLPQHENEDDESYFKRVQRTTLLNYFGKTVTTLSAKPFQEEARLGEKFPDELKEMEDDVDRQGSDLTSFCKKVFSDAMAKGFTGIMVDMPEPDPEIQTLEDEKKLGIRPYFCHVPAESIIAAYSEVVNGAERLTHVRIAEQEVQRDGYGESITMRVRVYEPGKWEVWEATDGKKWEKVKFGTTKLDYIPLVIWYAGKKLGTCKVTPPLIDLADKNVEHWQSASDQRNVLTVARFPILAVAGVEDIESITIGPRQVLSTADVGGKYYYVEHSGDAISAGSKDLDALKDEMAMMGLELLIRRTGNETATKTAVTTAQSHCELAEKVESCSDAIELCFSFAADWIDLEVDDEDLEVEFCTDFGIEENDIADFDVLKFARQNRDISREAFLAELKRRKTLSPNYDPEADQEVINGEPPPLGLMRMAPTSAPKGKGLGSGTPGAGSVVNGRGTSRNPTPPNAMGAQPSGANPSDAINAP